MMKMNEPARGETARQTEEPPLRELLQSVPVMMGVVEITPDGLDILHVYDSPATERFFGAGPGLTSGRTARELGVPPEAVAMWLGRYREAERVGGPVRFEYPHPRKAGQAWLSTVATPMSSDRPGARRFSYATEDVTERREAEERLRESEARMSLAIQAADLGTWEADLDTSAVRFGGAASRIFGRGEESFSLSLDEWLALVHPDDVGHVLRAIEGPVEREEYYRVEFRAHERAGAWRWIEARGLLVLGAEGRPIRALGVFADVTARKEAQVELERQVALRTAQLQASNDALESFTRHVAHDLRGPLRSILLACHLLGDEVSGEGARDVLERQERAAKRLSLLIDDLLEMARLSRTEAARAATDVTRIARAVANEAMATHPGTEVRVEVEEGLSADADPRLLRLALGNLLENAVKYSPDGGTVRVGRRDDGAFFVADEGIGIEPQYLDRVFEPFERLHTEARFKGTGIGLSNVRQIVGLHGGRVWVESEPAKGSTFLFTLG